MTGGRRGGAFYK